MLSYRKSQQVLLTEKLKMKNVIHIFGASGSGTTMARLCLSAFARVATRIFSAGAASCASLPQRIRAGCDRRHCEGTRLSGQLCHSAFVRVATSTTFSPSSPSPFATAHSRGLRLCRASVHRARYLLCHSAFARVATCIALLIR